MADAASSLDKHFDFKEREGQLYQMWEQSGLFRPQQPPYNGDDPRPVFNISMPPPNANGELHLGHSYGYTVMDILGRFHRLCGERVLLLPGKDHAGIQTQVVFEKKLKAEGVDVSKVPSEDLFDQCYAFCMDRAQYMRAQEKRLGLSADWSSEMFTLDPRLNEVIFETFERMWNDGLVYKGSRIVNWSVFSQTSISDVEVEYREQDGNLWYICYKLLDGPPSTPTDELTLPNGTTLKIGAPGLYTATTRPETMLGDTALAVNPEDPRYRALIGKKAIVPLVNREIPIIADKRVDMTYGTGVVKVTPAHDFADYDMGVDHNLEMIQVIGKDGKMTPAAGSEFVGLTSNACRAAVITKLEECGQLLDICKVKHKVPIGERGKDIIEPLISEQWFVAVDKPGKSLKQNALEAVRSGKIQIYPQRFGVLIEQWLENLHDWNISRQLWWGHRLPVWHRKADGKEDTFVGRKSPEGPGWIQETDVFDTWFSSGQWAFSTSAAAGILDMSAPKTKSDYFPTHTMVMGRDILLFWACRMLLLTTYRLNQVPWKHIFFTGLIRDEHGQKMSKSKGNGIDPNETIEKYGADSLRLALVMGASSGNDMAFSERKIDGYSKFINKLWNAAKLLEMKLGQVQPAEASAPQLKLESSAWILSELKRTFDTVAHKLETYEISIAADEAYNFTWMVFCDWYLEAIKVLLEKGSPEEQNEVRWVSKFVFETILTMLHPFIPFLTEEIYQRLSFVKRVPLLAGATWQRQFPVTNINTQQLALGMKVVGAVRAVKAALTISQSRIRISHSWNFSSEIALLVQELGRVEFCASDLISPEQALRRPIADGVVICEVQGKENYRKRLEKELVEHQASVANLETKLSGAFATQAKPEVVEKERHRLSNSKKAIVEISHELQTL